MSANPNPSTTEERHRVQNTTVEGLDKDVVKAESKPPKGMGIVTDKLTGLIEALKDSAPVVYGNTNATNATFDSKEAKAREAAAEGNGEREAPEDSAARQSEAWKERADKRGEERREFEYPRDRAEWQKNVMKPVYNNENVVAQQMKPPAGHPVVEPVPEPVKPEGSRLYQAATGMVSNMLFWGKKETDRTHDEAINTSAKRADVAQMKVDQVRADDAVKEDGSYVDASNVVRPGVEERGESMPDSSKSLTARIREKAEAILGEPTGTSEDKKKSAEDRAGKGEGNVELDGAQYSDPRVPSKDEQTSAPVENPKQTLEDARGKGGSEGTMTAGGGIEKRQEQLEHVSESKSVVDQLRDTAAGFFGMNKHIDVPPHSAPATAQHFADGQTVTNEKTDALNSQAAGGSSTS